MFFFQAREFFFCVRNFSGPRVLGFFQAASVTKQPASPARRGAGEKPTEEVILQAASVRNGFL